ncbi:DUF4382 domain-containing protein [Sapientia aquatica]|uniref:DUF4382 domain-containing protein n=1 Tax=Sapientia aquatica TaxID=1549640 RepID=A0A4R5VUM7_9BURK|nr:DUF4382 domain-containing protein [Sapientia aquatica]TDK62803.1 DUF4382 domain-containing protein [Sapientia aquatica]
MQQKKLTLALAAVGLISLLAACGGGGGSSGSSTGGTSVVPTAKLGLVNLNLTDGPSDVFNHVWVTVKAVSFHTDPNAVWSNADATWQTTTLPTPITLDLAQLNNGLMNDVFANLSLPEGTYKQIRFFFVSDSDALASSAQAISDNETTPQPLQWNDQVEYVNASGVVAEAPLEIANPVQGIQLQGTFTVTNGAPLNIATDFDLDKIVVPFRHGSMQSFTMKPDLAYFNLSNSGGISGNVDASKLCTSGSTSAPAANCAFNLVVHAEAISADGTRYQDIRSTSVKPDGTFTIAPLPITDASGNAISYDIVVRGRQMQTLMITGVKPAGTYAFASNTETLTGATQLQASAAPLPITIVNEYGTQLSSALNPLTAGHLVFEQTPTGGLPHEIRWAATNPFTGLIDRGGMAHWNQFFWMANSGLSVAPYSASGALTFAAVTPVEGTGNYSVIANEHAYYNFGSAVSLLSPLPNLTSVLFTANAPTLQSNVQSGTVTGTVSMGSIGAFTSAQIVVARNGAIITSQDIPAANWVANGTYQYSISGIGAGSATTALPGAYYYAYLRLDDGAGHHKIVPMSGYIDLRSTNSVTGMNVTVAL